MVIEYGDGVRQATGERHIKCSFLAGETDKLGGKLHKAKNTRSNVQSSQMNFEVPAAGRRDNKCEVRRHTCFHI
jgi:hypothetical protein